MAIFNKTKIVEKKKEVTPVNGTSHGNYADVLRYPRITEKATAYSLMGAYIFDVSPRANKYEIMMAVKDIYKVNPRKITIVTIPHKNVRSARTGKIGVKGGGKKAYVYLKKGETITLT